MVPAGDLLSWDAELDDVVEQLEEAYGPEPAMHRIDDVLGQARGDLQGALRRLRGEALPR